MLFDLNRYKTEEQKCDFLKTLINIAQKEFGNEADNNYAFQETNNYVNLLGVRGLKKGIPCVSTHSQYDDTMFVIYKSGANKHVKEFELSTEYGNQGTSILVLGQHKYVLHYHKEGLANHLNLNGAANYVSDRKYRALEPDATVRTINDTNRDLQKNAGESYEDIASINIHYGGTNVNTQGWSKGCQIIRGWDNYKEFIRLVESDQSIKGSINNELAPVPASDGDRAVIYTLVEGDFFEKVPMFPIDIQDGFSVNKKSINKYYDHTEKEYSGGYFPVGTNTVWHGGIHIHKTVGSKVAACATGKIIAARLGEETTAKHHYGSTNFILIRHTIAGKIFFSLYSHLNWQKLSLTNKNLENICWLQKEISHTAQSGESVSTIATKWGLTPDQIMNADENTEIKPHLQEYSGVWYYFVGDKVRHPGSAKPSQEILDQLKKGNVCKFDIPVIAGEPIWTVGEYGSEGHRTGILHWEIFSVEDIFPDWPHVRDTDKDFNMDTEKIMSLIEQDDSWFESDEILTSDELKEFYKSNKNAEKLRSYVCKFMSEWGIDLETAIDNMKGRWITFHLEDRIRPYLWWDETKKKGVPLPTQKHVWHYNPIRFVEALFNSELGE